MTRYSRVAWQAMIAPSCISKRVRTSIGESAMTSPNAQLSKISISSGSVFCSSDLCRGKSSSWFLAASARIAIAPPPLSTDQLLQVLGIPGTLHLYVGRGAVDLLQILGGQVHRGGAEVLVQALELRRARNGNNPRPLCEQPCQGNLSGCGMQLGADLAEQIDYGLVRLAILGVEPGNHVAKV